MSRFTRSLWQLTLLQFRALYRNKVALFFNLIFPLLMVAVFGSLYGPEETEPPAAAGTLDAAAAWSAAAGEAGKVVAAGETGAGAAAEAGAVFGFFDYLMPGQMATMLLSSGFLTVAIGLAVQRSTGALRHLFSTPVSIGAWAVARVLANLLMAFLQGVVLFAFAGAVFDVEPPANLPGTLAVVFVGSLLSLALGLVVGVLAKGEAGALAISMPIFMVLLFLGNAAMPIIDPPRLIAVLLPWLPTYHLTNALRGVMRFGDGLAAVLPEVALLAAISAVGFSIALWLLRRQFVVR